MGFFEPLTAFGLGRSPYDNVVYGRGPRPQSLIYQEYDNRGRPINPVSRDFNRRIIRSHNEVMHIIGVAEPDNSPATAEAELYSQYVAYETAMGYRMHSVGAGVLEGGLWGVNGIRNRIMVWRGYGRLPLREILMAGGKMEKGNKFLKLFGAGLPSMVALKMLRYKWTGMLMPKRLTPVQRQKLFPWVYALWSWISLHTHVWILFQRIGIITPYMLPYPLFFIPWTSISPITPLPSLPESLAFTSIGKWALKSLLTMGPIIAYGVWVHVEGHIHGLINERLTEVLPVPENTDYHYGALPMISPSVTEARDTPSPPVRSASVPLEPIEPLALPASITAPDLPVQSAPSAQPSQPSQPADPLPSTEVPLEHEHETPTVPRGPPSAYSTSSAASDVPAGPLISFDVETSDPADVPDGTMPWSAELRPTPADQRCSQVLYLTTLLSMEPQTLAAEILSNFASHVALATMELWSARWLVRTYLSVHPGLAATATSIGTVGSVAIWKDMGRRMAWNIVGVEMVHMAVMGEVWVILALIGRGLHFTQVEWRNLPAKVREEYASMTR